VLAKALGNGVNLLVAGAGAVGAAALHSWPILAIGGAAYAALVAWDAANPEFWKRALGRAGVAAPQRPKLPDPRTLADLHNRDVVAQIAAARTELERVLEGTSPEVVSHVTSSLLTLGELETHALKLIARDEAMARYQAGSKPDAVRAELDRLAARAKSATDAEARKQYDSASQARADQLRVLEEITSARDRIGANLSRIVAALESLPPRIVRMRDLDAQAMDDLSGDVNEELDRLSGDMKVFEETLKSLSEVTQ